MNLEHQLNINMLEFAVKFKNSPELIYTVDDTLLGQKYLTLLQSQYQQDPYPIFRDQQKYTTEYLSKLASEANQRLGWNWPLDNYNLETTVILHKDIEQFLAQGYSAIPEEFDHLLNEIHFCLHSVESGSRRNNWLQIEWYNDQGFSIEADEYPAKLDLEFGDLRLQNPYVGHHPLYLYQQKDSIDISQTCRFHDFAKPGLNLVISSSDRRKKEFDWTDYLSWFQQHGDEFVQKHGLDNLKKFTGHPVIGRVNNAVDLAQLILQPVIEFEYLKF